MENKSVPRGIRNNNPLNIRYNPMTTWKGKVNDAAKTDNQFEEFSTMVFGLRAALKLIHNYMWFHGCNTIEKIISRWAPASENNTSSYIAYVCKRTGLLKNEHLDFEDEGEMILLVHAMAEMECGVSISWCDILKAYVMLSDELELNHYHSYLFIVERFCKLLDEGKKN